MPDQTARDEAPEPIDPAAEDLAYELPPELVEEIPTEGPPARPPRSAVLKLAAVAALVLLVGAALLAYRVHHRRKAVASALARADALLRLDTFAGYREAASLLEPIAQLDPMDAASVRAFALAMLLADYRQGRAEAIDDLLVAPGRAEQVPAHAQLATAAVALGRKEAGTATTALARAGATPWARALEARVALLAGNASAAVEAAAAAAADGLPAAYAVHGDALRRLRTDPAAGRAAYEAALAASPRHARAAYGIAKLALGGGAPAQEAERALRRILDDRQGTLAPERARAGLHLAALRLRAGDRTGADAALDLAGLDGPARAWAARAAAVAAEQRGSYRAVSGAPAALQSASDDDPGVLSPTPPPPPAAAAPRKTAAAKVPPRKAKAVRSTPVSPSRSSAAAKATPSKGTAAQSKATTQKGTSAKKKGAPAKTKPTKRTTRAPAPPRT